MAWCITRICVINSPSVIIYKDKQALAKGSALFIAEQAKRSIQNTNKFRLVLSGGSTPKLSYQHLASIEISKELDWGKTQIFWGDERMVGPDHPESNYRMAKEALLDHIPILEENIFRIKGELPINIAAEEYEEKLFQFSLAGNPLFDLVLLGIGEDGHTASLFPNSKGLKTLDKYVIANFAAEQNAWRISMTLLALNNTKTVLFFASGSNKASIIATILEGDEVMKMHYPAAGISPEQGAIYWMLDKEAASKLRGSYDKA